MCTGVETSVFVHGWAASVGAGVGSEEVPGSAIAPGREHGPVGAETGLALCVEHVVQAVEYLHHAPAEPAIVVGVVWFAAEDPPALRFEVFLFFFLSSFASFPCDEAVVPVAGCEIVAALSRNERPGE